MGGYFIGRPMDPESRPAKTKKAKAGSHYKLHGLGWDGDKPTKAHDEERTRKEGVQVQPGVLTWKAKA